MRCAQLVIGPAGSGKSTYCELMRTHLEAMQRRVHVINLDPAADLKKLYFFLLLSARAVSSP